MLFLAPHRLAGASANPRLPTPTQVLSDGHRLCIRQQSWASGGEQVGTPILPRVSHPRHRGQRFPFKQPCALPAAATQSATSILQELSTSVLAPHPGVLVGTLLNTAVFIAGFKVLRKGLTLEGIAHAWFLGASIFSAFGAAGYLLVCLYFILGNRVTKIKLEQKQKEGIAEARSGERGPGSVWGSGIAGVGCALLAITSGQYHLLQIGFVASFASKLSDTVSSEIGKAYGRTTYLVTTLERVPRGTEGAVSAEGTAAGVAAALLFSAVACMIGQVSPSEAVVAAGAAVVANLFESYLGAVVQGQVEWLTNDVVNMTQICLAAALAVGVSAMRHPPF